MPFTAGASEGCTSVEASCNTCGNGRKLPRACSRQRCRCRDGFGIGRIEFWKEVDAKWSNVSFLVIISPLAGLLESAIQGKFGLCPISVRAHKLILPPKM